MSDPLVIACPACGAKNRVAPERFKDRPVCGKCGKALPAGGRPFAVAREEFRAAVLEAPLPVLVDFWATWCGPCKAVAPVLEEIAAENAGRLLVAKVDVDASPLLASRFGVQGVPTLVLFHRGLELDRRVGAHPKSSILGMLDRIA